MNEILPGYQTQEHFDSETNKLKEEIRGLTAMLIESQGKESVLREEMQQFAKAKHIEMQRVVSILAGQREAAHNECADLKIQLSILMDEKKAPKAE